MQNCTAIAPGSTSRPLGWKLEAFLGAFNQGISKPPGECLLRVLPLVSPHQCWCGLRYDADWSFTTWCFISSTSFCFCCLKFIEYFEIFWAFSKWQVNVRILCSTILLRLSYFFFLENIVYRRWIWFWRRWKRITFPSTRHVSSEGFLNLKKRQESLCGPAGLLQEALLEALGPPN